MSIARETEAFQVYLEACRTLEDTVDENAELQEDMAKGRAAMEVAWLNALHPTSVNPCSFMVMLSKYGTRKPSLYARIKRVIHG